MNMENEGMVYINGLLLHPQVQKLKLVDDKGITVAAHTYDVLRITLEEINKKYSNDIEQAINDIDLFVLIVGTIIHDTTKGSLRLNDSNMSHSKVMKNKPHLAIQEAKGILKDVESFTHYKLKGDIKEKIYHIVASHHGRWGKIKPETYEAKTVHKADKYSAMYHRITPIGAKDIIKLMDKGFSKKEVLNITGYTKGIINSRLKKARSHLKIRTTKKLLEYYNDTGEMVDGDEFFSKRIKETKKLIKRVDKIGFEKLILSNNLLKYIESDDVFK